MRKFTQLAIIVGAWVLSKPAFATSQCPSEFGPKSPIVNAMGWGVIAIGVILGGLLLSYAINRSRGAALLKRVAAIGLGLVALGLTSIGGLALAVGLFFLQC